MGNYEKSYIVGGRIPVLDGIRGLAILLVLVFHTTMIKPHHSDVTGIDALYGSIMGFGWSGVELFFVLSGFLITGILFDAKNGDHYFKNFYARRFLRIFPLYYALVVVALIIIPNLPDGIVPQQQLSNLARIEGDEIWYWLFLSNFSIAAADAFRHGILDISWSLAIEEQFYLIWPFVVLSVNRERLMQICLALIAGALLLRVGMIWQDYSPMQVRVFTLARMDTLAVGAYLAMIIRDPHKDALARLARPSKLIIWAGLAILIVLLVRNPKLASDELLSNEFTNSGIWLMTVGFTMISLFYGALVVVALRSDHSSRVYGFFTNSFMCFFGKYSYALYLLHLPIRAAIRELVDGKNLPYLLGSQIPAQLAFSAVCIAAAVVAALLSWNILEKRALSLNRYFRS